MVTAHLVTFVISSPSLCACCRNLVKKLLTLRASARPDLGTVLAYPIIKKALRAYLQDIFGRTDEKMGQGTMLIREGARAVARDAGSIHRASAPEVHFWHICNVLVYGDVL